MTTTSDPHESSREATGEREEEAKRRDWLELTLGFASVSESSSSSSSFLPHPTCKGQLPLGLNLGFENMMDLSHEKLVTNGNFQLPLPVFSSSPSSSSSFLSPNFSLASSPLLPPNLASRNLAVDIHGQSRMVVNGTSFYMKRPNPGLWFRLRSVVNRCGELLPQVPKAYIRVKDENVTIYMVKTYLVRKLALSNESEVEISCLGQKLQCFQTMSYARDVMWLPKLVEFLHSNPALDENSPGTTMRYLMCLDYERSVFSQK